MAFEIYGTILAKAKTTVLFFPLRHQILNLLVLLVLHLADRSLSVAQVRGQAQAGLQRPGGEALRKGLRKTGTR